MGKHKHRREDLARRLERLEQKLALPTRRSSTKSPPRSRSPLRRLFDEVSSDDDYGSRGNKSHSTTPEPIIEIQDEQYKDNADIEKENEPNPEDNIPDEILQILGESKKTEEEFGKEIPHEISKRWGKILQDGLDKEIKENLVKKVLVPNNFPLCKAPKLNPEVAAVLTDSTKNRDKRLEKSQNQLGHAIAAGVNLTTSLIEGEMEKFEIIKKLSEMNQILLDLHYEETLNRRRLIIPNLDKSFWNIIQGVKRDVYLFGDNLGDNIKNTKNIERTGQQIKKSETQPTTSNNKRPNCQGNMKQPPRTAQSGPRQPATQQPARFFREQRDTAPATRRQPAPAARQQQRAQPNRNQSDRRNRQ